MKFSKKILLLLTVSCTVSFVLAQQAKKELPGNESSVTINDLANDDGSAAGTEVIIKMPIIES